MDDRFRLRTHRFRVGPCVVRSPDDSRTLKLMVTAVLSSAEADDERGEGRHDVRKDCGNVCLQLAGGVG